MRRIGKRNEILNGLAIKCAEQILPANPRSSRRVAWDALKEIRKRASGEAGKAG
jgi:hypothetical protein